MPFTVTVSAEALRDQAQSLFDTTTAFGDPELHGANKSLLAAACCQSGDLSKQAHELRTAPAQLAKVLVDLVHGQSVELVNDADQFFDLFKLVKRMKIQSCMEVCQDVVNSTSFNGELVRLHLSVDQAQSIRRQLDQWRTALVPEWTDVTLLVRDQEAAAKRVHLVLLAAHSEYFRALWAGSFKEQAATAQEIILEASEAKAADMLVNILYGNVVEASSEEELVNLYCLADRWQCSLVSSATLQAMETQNAMIATVAVDILGWHQPAPEVLAQAYSRPVDEAAVRAIQSSQFEGDLIIQSMPMLAACRLLRILDNDCSDVVLMETLQKRILSSLCDQDVEKFGLVQISRSSMLTLLKLEIDRADCPKTKLPGNLASWARALEEHSAEESAGSAFAHVAKLSWEGAPSSITETLQSAIAELIERYAESPCVTFYEILCGTIEPLDAGVLDGNDEADTKRRKVTTTGKPREMKCLQTGLEPHMKRLIIDSALNWSTKNAMLIIQGSVWSELQPEVFVPVAIALLKLQGNGECAEPEVKKGIAEWIQKSQVQDVIRALRIAHDEPSTERAEISLFHLLTDAIQTRWAESEHQNAVLQGGRHKEDIAVAVKTSNQELEAKLRAEFDKSMSSLRESLSKEHKQQLTDVETRNQIKVEDMKKKICAVLDQTSS